ncbi:hypothetical protein dsx2_0291 [Desulfovibrio sp. X2]|uniref:hypothetical protein n=1 Tax=Desulfovibrio sp. X2 TaxID=941449 RepID=UPI0003588D77|nr:hypothetical protein [Desulfovibrio sp. X2]EPR42364.1 hypothetical protein dsx2_0291 [Desulfovibrio sp. X2]
MTGSEKISSMNDYRKGSEDGSIPVEATDKTSRDLGKVAIFISILSILLLAVFFFGLNQNIKGLSADMKTVNTDVSQLKTTVAELPAKMQRSMVVDQLHDITSKLDYLRGKVSPADAAKLEEALQTIMAVQNQGAAAVAPEAAPASVQPAPEPAAAQPAEPQAAQ